jgi:hypothetical protein
MPLLHRRSEHDVDVDDRLDPHGRGDAHQPDGDRDGIDDRAETGRRPLTPQDQGRAAAVGATPGTVDERVSVSDHGGWNSAVRIVAMVAAGVAVVMGLIALLRVDWGVGLDGPAVDVAGMAFTPWVAIITVAVGVVALAAAAFPGRGSKFVVGAVLACGGIGIIAASDANRANLDVERAHGWLALLVGAVLVLSGLLLRNSRTTRRRVRAGQTPR